MIVSPRTSRQGGTRAKVPMRRTDGTLEVHDFVIEEGKEKKKEYKKPRPKRHSHCCRVLLTAVVLNSSTRVCVSVADRYTEDLS
jgi:hypothetical protein